MKTLEFMSGGPREARGTIFSEVDSKPVPSNMLLLLLHPHQIFRPSIVSAVCRFSLTKQVFSEGVVHKLSLQDEIGRWSKNVHFLSTFIP
jgi:hypothetical protein